METLEKIKALTEQLSVDATKFYNGNKSAGTRTRKTAQELKTMSIKKILISIYTRVIKLNIHL